MYFAWTDDHERETVHAPSLALAALAYARARVDNIDGQTISLEDVDGVVRRFVVVDGVAIPSE